jgi:hypothetical protein
MGRKKEEHLEREDLQVVIIMGQMKKKRKLK